MKRIQPKQFLKQHKSSILVHIILILITLVIIAPILFMAIKATQDTYTALSPSLVPGGLFWKNIIKAWSYYNMDRYMVNTLIITTSITMGKTLLSILAAMIIVYFRIPGKVFIFWAILITLYIPTDLIAIGLFDVVSQQNPSVGEFLLWIINPFKVFFQPISFGFDWTNTYRSVVVPFLASATGTFLFVQHFRAIPRSFAEVALIEGMNSIQYLFRILIPVSINTVGALWVIQFISFWNQYFWPRLIIQDNESQVIQVAIRAIVLGGDQIEWGVLMASSCIVIIPPLIVFLVLIRQLRSGVAMSTGK